MTPTYNAVTDKQKEHCAIVNMRLMLTEYAKKNNIPFDDAVLLFAESPVYTMLFDYDTNLWMEGPRYLMAYFDEYLASTTESHKG